MGCASSKPPSADNLRAGLPAAPQQQQRAFAERSGFAIFLSHYKTEAATEARWLQEHLEREISQRVFLDSDDLTDLSRLKDHVLESKCIALLQTRSVLSRPWCLVELLTAIDARVPIIGISITSGTAPYDFTAALAFMTHLDSALDADARAALAAHGIDVADAAFKLANTLPNIIAVPLNMNASQAILSASVSDIVAAMEKAVLPALPDDKDAWFATRGDTIAPPSHEPGNAATSDPQAAGVAAVPPEVP